MVKNLPTPLEIRNQIVDIYANNDISCLKLSRQFGISGPTIAKIIKKSGHVVRNDRRDLALKYSCNENYFAEIDSEEKAYWLGFLYADGCNSENRGSIKLALAKQDLEILEKFKASIEFTGPIREWKHKRECDKNKQDGVGVTVSSWKMSKDLARLGCFQRKTFTLKFPTQDQVPDHLIRHFVRGYFDGDGCFCVTYPFTLAGNPFKKYVSSIVSTKDFCEELRSILSKKLGITSKMNVRHKERNNSTRNLIFTNATKSFIFLDWIYHKSTVYLDRKYNKYVLERDDLYSRRAMRNRKQLKSPDQVLAEASLQVIER